VVPVGLAGTTSILGLFTAACDVLTGGQHGLPSVFALGSAESLGGLFINEELATFDAAAAEYFKNHLVKLNIVYGPC
jgi:hypothetical protein